MHGDHEPTKEAVTVFIIIMKCVRRCWSCLPCMFC